MHKEVAECSLMLMDRAELFELYLAIGVLKSVTRKNDTIGNCPSENLLSLVFG